ncbi:MAG: AtzH-like domain-containing protein [Pseudomonadota bacterium]
MIQSADDAPPGDLPADVRARIEGEIRSAFDRYETALMANDVDALMALFWDDPRTVRLTAQGGAYGVEEIARFRQARDTSDIARSLTRVEITALSLNIGYANAEYRRTGSGRIGAQSHLWIRTPDGWKIASAHVSLS